MAISVAIRPSDGRRTWTVVDEAYRTVGPVEDWLEAHRLLWSPNTVRGYATAMAQWWSFLEQRGEDQRWQEVGVPPGHSVARRALAPVLSGTTGPAG